MRRKPLESLGTMVREHRADRTLREVAAEIGVGPATLLRVESGRIPDVATFGKICQWINVDPGIFLGVKLMPDRKGAANETDASIRISAHFKADQTPNPDTIRALAQLLLYAAGAQKRVRPARADEHP